MKIKQEKVELLNQNERTKIDENIISCSDMILNLFFSNLSCL